MAVARPGLIRFGVVATLVLGVLSPGFDSSDNRAWAAGTACASAFGPIEAEDEPQQNGGSGPYLVTNEKQLVWISENQDTLGVLGRDYLQTKNINLAHCEWTPIGSFGGGARPFDGTYDGGGFEIQGLRISSGYSSALFRLTRAGSVISDLVLRDVSIASADGDTAAVVGNNVGHIENVSVSGSLLITGNSSGAAAIAAYNDGTIVNTRVDISISVSSPQPNHGYAGGVVGYNEGTIDTCDAVVVISFDGYENGGVAGYSSGAVTGCRSSGSITGSEYVGGIVGNNEGTVSESRSSATISGSDWGAGGVVGYNEGLITSAWATGSVKGKDAVGGLVGGNDGSVSRSFATGSVTATGNSAGGLLGEHYGTVSESYASGAVVGTVNVGGLVGEGWGSMTDAYSRGSVVGTQELGGLVGLLYAIGPANTVVTPITRSYATGAVSSGVNTGGLVGKIWPDNAGRAVQIVDSFFDGDSTGQSTSIGLNGTVEGSGGGESKTSEQMKDVATYVATPPNWPIVAVADYGQAAGPEDEIWAISAGINDGYPFLWWEEEPEVPEDEGATERTTNRVTSRASSSAGSSTEQTLESNSVALAPSKTPDAPEAFSALQETETPSATLGEEVPLAPEETSPNITSSNTAQPRYTWLFVFAGIAVLGGIGVVTYLRMRPRRFP